VGRIGQKPQPPKVLEVSFTKLFCSSNRVGEHAEQQRRVPAIAFRILTSRDGCSCCFDYQRPEWIWAPDPADSLVAICEVTDEHIVDRGSCGTVINRMEWAASLLLRNIPGDRSAARDLIDKVVEESIRVGFPPGLARAQELISQYFTAE
jgi:hypothetical protein